MNRCASLLRPLVVSGLLLGTLASAAPRIVVGELKGDKRGALTHQISDQLCATFDCVPARGILAKQKVNWKSAKRAKVEGVFVGTVAKSRKGATIILSLEKHAGKPARKWTLATRNGKVSAAALRQVTDDLGSLLGGGAPPPEAAPATTPPATSEAIPPATPPATTAVEPAPAQSGTVAEVTPATPATETGATKTSETTEASSSSASAAARKQSWLAVEVGVDFLNRNLSYANLTSNNLRTYSAPLLLAPHLHLDLFPLAAGSNPGVLGGLGLEADYAISVGLKSATAGDTSHPTSYSRLDFDLTWRFGLGNVVTVAPFVGYRIAKFTVSPDATGNVYSGLPDFADNGLVVGIGGDFLLSDHGFRILARLDYMPKVSGGDLLSTAYFATGSASGLDVALGVSIPLVSHLDLRVMGLLTRYSYSFTAQPTDTYVATGASDVYLGGRATLRYSF